MSLRVCSVPGCPALSAKSRCPAHRAEARRLRGTTTEQGLGWAHQQRRRQLIAAAIDTRCPDCGAWMTDPARMVADHSTPRSVDRASMADRVHCRECSDRQGGRLSTRNTL